MPFAGQIAGLVIGTEGLVGSKNQATIRPQQLLEALNLTYASGTLKKEGGASKYNGSAIGGAPRIIGGWDWIPSGTTQRMVVVTSGGDILKDSGGGSFGTTLASGLTVSDVVPVFAEGGNEAAGSDRKLFIATEKNALQVLAADGATAAAVSSGSADWSGSNHPRFALAHEGRIWTGGNANDPYRLYYSDTADHENFTGGASGSISVYPGEGERLAWAVSFKGLIVAAKFPIGIYMVDTSDTSTANWRVTRLSSTIGAIGPRAVTLIDDDILFMDPAGNLQLISAITEFGNLGSENLSNIAGMNEFMQNNVNLNQLSETKAIFYPAKREAHFAVPRSGDTANTARLVVDFNRADLIRFRFSTLGTAEDIWLKKDSNQTPRPAVGDDAGFVWDMDQDSRSEDGSGYNGQFQSPHLDLSELDPRLATVRKEGKFLELVMEPIGNWNLAVDVLWDGVLTQTVQFNMGTTGSTLGSFVLGTDKLAGEQVLNKKKRITGGGRRISIRGRNSGDGQDFSVSKFMLHFMLGTEKL